MKKPKLIKTFIINDLSERDYLEILKRKIRKYIIAIMLSLQIMLIVRNN